jgi:hypothetical protein
MVRVVEYTIADGRELSGPYRLLTTILDRHSRSAPVALAACHAVKL